MVANGSKTSGATDNKQVYNYGMNDSNSQRIIKPLNYQQKLAIDFWCGNRRRSKAEALREAGYSEAIARQPHKFFNSPAVRKELALRGYGTSGISNNEKPATIFNEAEKIKSSSNPVIDISKTPKEVIQELQQRLREEGWKPNPVKEEEPQNYGQPSFYIEDNQKYPPTENFSSM